MSDPAYQLQKAIYELLIASGVADGKVFERVPDKTSLPYAQIGSDVITAADDAGPWSECTVLVNVLGHGKLSLKQHVKIVRNALDQPIEVEGFILMEYGFEQCRYMTQQDGITEMAAMEFRYLLQPA